MNDAFDVVEGDVLVRDGRIVSVGPAVERADRVIDARGGYLLPGFIQTHIHLCQTLFRGYADDLALLDWLKTRVWPMEAAHTPRSLAAAAQQAAAELLRSGTTTVLTMETVHDTDAVFDALEPMGLRAVVGKCMMDADAAVPRRLMEQIALIKARTGRRNIDYLADTGLASPHLCLAHCVWVDESEQALMAERDVKVLHCPGSNLKLGSGLAPVVEMRAKGISVSLGADGAACNNHLDMFEEMRLAAVLQSVRHRPGALTARDALWMATREGALALGLEAEIGSVEPGKRADLIVVDASGPDPYSTLVYASRGTDVRTTIVDGEVLVDNFEAPRWDTDAIARAARQEAQALAARAGLF